MGVRREAAVFAMSRFIMVTVPCVAENIFTYKKDNRI
jgi:hypothetical protein